MHTKSVRFATENKVSTQPTSAPGVPAAPSLAARKLGFDFADFQQKTQPRASKLRSKKWRLGNEGFTRKKFGGAGKRFWQSNSSRQLVDQALPASNALKLAFPGPKVAAATEAVEKGKIEDTEVFYAHLKVLVAAQKKWEAQLPMEQAKKELDDAGQALKAYHQQIQDLQLEGLATARQRLDEMKQRRDETLAAKGTAGLPVKQAHHLMRAQRMAASLVRKVTVPTAITTPESKRNALTKTKNRLLSRLRPKEGGEQAKQTARMAELTKAAERRKTEVVVDHEALHREIAARAKAKGQTAQEYIEYLLLDKDVGAYLPPVVFDALQDVHAQLSQYAQKAFVAEANASLALGKQRVEQLKRAYNEARTAYEAMPMPG